MHLVQVLVIIGTAITLVASVIVVRFSRPQAAEVPSVTAPAPEPAAHEAVPAVARSGDELDPFSLVTGTIVSVITRSGTRYRFTIAADPWLGFEMSAHGPDGRLKRRAHVQFLRPIRRGRAMWLWDDDAEREITTSAVIRFLQRLPSVSESAA